MTIPDRHRVILAASGLLLPFIFLSLPKLAKRFGSVFLLKLRFPIGSLAS